MSPALSLVPSAPVDPLQPAHHAVLAIQAAEIVPSSYHVRFPWADLDTLYGPLLPGDLHIVSARTGSGKTLFVRNWLRALASAEPPTRVAYFPTETPAADVLRDLVCADLHVDPVAVRRDDFTRIAGGYQAFAAAAQRLSAYLFTPTPPSAARLTLYDLSRPSVADVRTALLQAAEQGVRVAIIDHLLRLALGDGRDLFAEVSRAVRALKDLAQEAGLAIVLTSQQGRTQGGDRLSWYAPPDLQALKGAGTIEEEADGVLFLHRVLKDDLTDKDRAAVRAGAMTLQEVIAPNLMACAIGKHRLDGKQTGAACRLWVEHGRVGDLPADVRRAWQAAQANVRTSRDMR